MADLRLDLSRVDADLKQDYEDAEEGFPVSPLDESLIDDNLTPLERLEKFYATEEIFERDLAVREIPTVIETIASISEFEKLCYIADKLARDTEAVIRMSMLNNISSLLEKSCLLGYVENELQRMQESIMEIPIRMLRDVHDQVRRVAHICLANLLEEERGKELLLQLVCPAVIHLLTSEGNYDLKLDAISLISKLSPYLGRDVMLKEFVPLFKGLSCDGIFHVRKAFAICCKDICPVLDDDSVEEYVLPLFLCLCKDEVWGVRKACADVFTDVSYASLPTTRREKLTPSFLQLLSDPSRWVRKAAYQSLGPFISTFYDPDAYSSPEDYLVEKESLEHQLGSDNAYQFEDHNTNGGVNNSSNTTEQSSHLGRDCSGGKNSPTDVKVECINCACHMETVKVNVVASSETLESVEYSSFNFWKTPLTQVDDLDLDSLTLEDNGDAEKSPKTLHVHLTLSDSAVSDDTEIADSALAKNSEKQAEDTHTNDTIVDSLQQHTCLSNTVNDTDEVPVFNSDNTAIIDSDNITAIHHCEEAGDGDLLLVSNEDQSSDERTSPILVSDVVTNELGEEIIEISEIDAKDDDAISKQLTSLSNNANTSSNSGSTGLHIINNKTQAGWGSLSSSGEDVQVDGGMISCLIPRVKITSHTDLSFGISGVVNFDSHDNSMNFDPNDYYHKTTSSQVDMEITLDGVEEGLASKQDVVPPEILENYLSMANQSKMVDSELAFHCAFSFPAVAMTLGATHWSILSSLYRTLAGDIQWKIRRVLAYSIHEIARIIGPDATCTELLGIFEGFLKDIDEVRVGVLTHLAEFLELIISRRCFRSLAVVFVGRACAKYDVTIAGEEARQVLPVEEQQRHVVILKDFMKFDNDRNWRYRQLLIDQLIFLCDLYSVQSLVEHVVPIAMELARSRVSELRLNAHGLLGIILEKLEQMGDIERCCRLLQTLREDFANSNHWKLRMGFVQSCTNLLLEGHISVQLFTKELLEAVVLLATDPIPNVRLAVARILKQVIIANDYFLRNDNRLGLSCGSLFPVLETLQNDIDQDVRCFAGGQVESDTHSEDHTCDNFEGFQDPFEMDLRDRSFSEVERVIYGQHLNENIKTNNSPTEDDNKLESHC